MIKFTSRIYLILIILIAASGFPYVHAQEGDDCNNNDKKLRSTFNGSVLYGEYGATSQLEKVSNFDKYKPANAFDNNLTTSWVEGKPGDGLGDNLVFYTLSPVKKIGILPGYGTEQHYPLNNRVKSARLAIHEIAGRNANQCLGMFYTKGRLVKVENLEFEDAMTMQYFDLEDIPGSPMGYMYIIEITSVYKGSKFKDTCIAEIAIE